MLPWFAQGVGVLAVLGTVLAFIGKTRSQILSRQMAAAVLFCLHFAYYRLDCTKGKGSACREAMRSPNAKD